VNLYQAVKAMTGNEMGADWARSPGWSAGYGCGSYCPSGCGLGASARFFIKKEKMDVGIITEKGKLPFGIEDKDGVRHRDFEIRPRLVKDTMEIAREQGIQKLEEAGDVFFMMCLLSRQILHIGSICPVPVDLLLDLYEEDMAVIVKAREDLAMRLESFRASIEADGEADASTIATGADTPNEKDRPGAVKDTTSDG
jgi:phage FluMu protein gp41